MRRNVLMGKCASSSDLAYKLTNKRDSGKTELNYTLGAISITLHCMEWPQHSWLQYTRQLHVYRSGGWCAADRPIAT